MSIHAPSNHSIPASNISLCGNQNLSSMSCLKIFCEEHDKDVPDLKVLAQNCVNGCGVKEVNEFQHTYQQPVKCTYDIVSDGSLQINTGFISVVRLCGNKNSRDESDPGENQHREEVSCVYRPMPKDMKCEKYRLETFNSWPLSYINPVDLAAVGFYYLEHGDKVQCAFCRGIIADWALGDDPLTEHTLHFPLCPFLLNRDVGNIPISGKNPFTDRYNNSFPENSEYLKQANCASAEEISSSAHPKFSKMESKEKRLNTFWNWQSSAVKPDALVDAGFFFTGTADIATCFYCGGTLGHWDSDDDPYAEHKKHFPQCAYLKSVAFGTVSVSSNVLQDSTFKPKEISESWNVSELMKSKLCVEAMKIFSETLVREALERQLSKKGKEFQSLEDLCSAILEIQDEVEKKTKARVESQVPVQSRTNSSVDRHMCKICWDKEMGIVFLPCGHMVACPECAKSVSTCPLCRKTIEDTVRAYMS